MRLSPMYAFYKRSCDVRQLEKFLDKVYPVPFRARELLSMYVSDFKAQPEHLSYGYYYRNHLKKYNQQDRKKISAFHKGYLAWRTKPLDEETYRSVCTYYNQQMINEVLEGEDVRFPKHMGMLCIRKRKINWDKLKTDYNTSKKLGIRVGFTEDHTDGYRFRFCWFKPQGVPNQFWKNLRYFRFLASKKHSKQLHLRIMSGQDYLVG